MYVYTKNYEIMHINFVVAIWSLTSIRRRINSIKLNSIQKFIADKKSIYKYIPLK